MFSEKKKSTIAAFALCIAVALFTTYSVVKDVIDIASGEMHITVSQYFSYFTIESNVLCAILSIVVVIYLLCGKDNQSDNLPLPLLILHFISTAAVVLTCLTVVFYLAPTQGFAPMFGGTNIFLHLLTPIVAAVSFVAFEGSKGFKFADSLFGMIPALLYGTVYFYMVVILGPDNGGWNDFYGFNVGGMWYISIIAMAALMTIIGTLLYFLNRKLHVSKVGKQK